MTEEERVEKEGFTLPSLPYVSKLHMIFGRETVKKRKHS